MTKRIRKIGLVLILVLSVQTLLSNCKNVPPSEDAIEDFLTYEVDPAVQDLKMYWQNSDGENYGNAEQLKNHLAKQNKKLLFAVNGGMYNKHGAPQGLYIENGRKLAKLDSATSGYGNFYMQPNGIFYLTKSRKAGVTTTQKFTLLKDIQFATQSGPMLISEGIMNELFMKDSESLNYRNGVGILPNGNVYFVQSKQEVNFYEFAQVFADKGCENALYLDGYVSRTYLPAKKWEQLDGNFGVMIAVTE